MELRPSRKDKKNITVCRISFYFKLGRENI